MNVVKFKSDSQINSMKPLFQKALQRLKVDFNINENQTKSISQLCLIVQQKFKGPIKAKDMVRIPKHELRTALKVPCLIKVIDTQQIKMYKKLRITYSIEEPNICSRCPLNKQCPLKNKIFREETQARLQHILYFLFQFGKRKHQDLSILRWTSAYKVAESIRIMLRDSTKLRSEALLFRTAQEQEEDKGKRGKEKNGGRTKQIQEKTQLIMKNRKFSLSQNKKSVN